MFFLFRFVCHLFLQMHRCFQSSVLVCTSVPGAARCTPGLQIYENIWRTAAAWWLAKPIFPASIAHIVPESRPVSTSISCPCITSNRIGVKPQLAVRKLLLLMLLHLLLLRLLPELLGITLPLLRYPLLEIACCFNFF